MRLLRVARVALGLLLAIEKRRPQRLGTGHKLGGGDRGGRH